MKQLNQSTFMGYTHQKDVKTTSEVHLDAMILQKVVIIISKKLAVQRLFNTSLDVQSTFFCGIN